MLGGSKSSGEILDTRPSEPHSIVGVLVGWKLPLVHVVACFVASEGPDRFDPSCLEQPTITLAQLLRIKGWMPRATTSGEGGVITVANPVRPRTLTLVCSCTYR